MKKFLCLIVMLLMAGSVYGAKLNQPNLQGHWEIVEMQGEKETEGDQWVFKGNQFQQKLSGMNLAPDEFTISGDAIDLGYAKIKVKSLTSSTLKANMAGFDYVLKKK